MRERTSKGRGLTLVTGILSGLLVGFIGGTWVERTRRSRADTPQMDLIGGWRSSDGTLEARFGSNGRIILDDGRSPPFVYPYRVEGEKQYGVEGTKWNWRELIITLPDGTRLRSRLTRQGDTVWVSLLGRMVDLQRVR